MVSQNMEVFLTTSPWINADFLKSNNISYEEELVFIKKIGTFCHYKKDRIIIGIGTRVDRFFYLQDGIVKYTLLSRGGSEKPVLYVSPGCFFGDEAFFHGQPVIFNALAMEDVKAISIHKHHLNELFSRPGLVYMLLKSVSLKSRMLANQIEDLAFRNTTEKLCRLLYCLLLDPSSKQKINTCIKFTHHELANLAGVHRVTVTNAISHLKEEGIIHTLPDGTIVVDNWDKLRKYGFGE
ncbi:Crp/Fnr family transcriptional regulator [Moorella sulfitireducens]|uniref:Crp/Fnr family transcriptional regulator n=1 Tax=Neomoorella sulfitireducens TaxID=2972948 RepID=UPI0021AC9E7D|nr:Crp/Fnr family transcriptional regulator [Moorella sulfitireducens]